MSRTFFAYQVAHALGPFNKRRYYTNSPTPRVNDVVYVVSGDLNEQGFVDYSLEGKFRVGRRTEGSFTLPSKSGELRSFDLELALLPIQVPNVAIQLVQTDWYDREHMRRYFGSSQNFNPLPNGYEEKFTAALAEFAFDQENELGRDLAEIAQSSELDDSEKDALIKARLGQGKFRRAVIELWGNGQTCALTGIAVPEILIASHIKAWRHCESSSERLDGANGLLLAANIDRLFDRQLISFKTEKADFLCVLSKRVRPYAAALGLSNGRPLRSGALSPSEFNRVARYMVDHYAEFRELDQLDSL